MNMMLAPFGFAQARQKYQTTGMIIQFFNSFGLGVFLMLNLLLHWFQNHIYVTVMAMRSLHRHHDFISSKVNRLRKTIAGRYLFGNLEIFYLFAVEMGSFTVPT